MRIWGIHKKYSTFSWFENFMGGHVSFCGITIFGANAMNWAVNISTRWGYLCFTLPVAARWRRNSMGQLHYSWYMYLSPNCTPWAATWYIGSDKSEHIRAKIRKLNFGHGFNSGSDTNAENYKKLRAINSKYSCFYPSDQDIEETYQYDKQG